MRMAKLIGREKELLQLAALRDSNESHFVVVYGRRRVGKTFLINHFFNDTYTFKVTGLAKKDKKMQLANFGASLRKYGSPLSPIPKNWMEAFSLLRTMLDAIHVKGKIIVFIDELPFMYTQKSDLVTALEHFWNDWGCTKDNLVLIVCGSATSWITKKILRNKGGLHNRVTDKIYLHPFTLAECKKYYQSRGIQLSDKDIVESYMVMGGIPYYLSLVEKGKSLAQNIDEMFFLRKGKLDGEFEDLYASLYEKSADYIKVVTALGTKSKGLSRDEILRLTKLTNNGAFSDVLQDLEDCDIIRHYKEFGKEKYGGLYQLIDFYTLFYLKFLKNYAGQEKPFWALQQNTPMHNTWAGYAFEQLCLCHYPQIERALSIGGIQTSVSAWRSDDAQIDLLITRADRIIDVCEIKFWREPFTITKSYEENLQRKINSFINDSRTRYAVHLVMITTYGIVQNQHSGIVQAEVVMNDLFKEP